VRNKHMVSELLGLPGSEQLGECSRCGESPFPLLQLKVIGHQVALCRTCLRRLLDILEHGIVVESDDGGWSMPVLVVQPSAVDDGCYDAGGVNTPGLHRPECNAIRNAGQCDAGLGAVPQ
jgi:hypothetical protein